MKNDKTTRKEFKREKNDPNANLVHNRTNEVKKERRKKGKNKNTFFSFRI